MTDGAWPMSVRQIYSELPFDLITCERYPNERVHRAAVNYHHSTRQSLPVQLNTGETTQIPIDIQKKLP